MQHDAFCARRQLVFAGKQAGLNDEAIRLFTYEAANEHRIEYDVNKKTGKATSVRIDGRRIAPVAKKAGKP